MNTRDGSRVLVQKVRNTTAAPSGEVQGRKRVASVELRGLTKRYGDVAVVDDISLTIEHGHLVCLLGPSGCGKTTTLRLIAGFVEPSEGRDPCRRQTGFLAARTVPPEKRNMSMIFQSYALWPHMTVAENIVYGLKLRKMDRDSIGKKLDAILATTRLAPLGATLPRGIVRRTATARGTRARAHRGAGNAAARRAAVQPRRQFARGNAFRECAACTTPIVTRQSM